MGLDLHMSDPWPGEGWVTLMNISIKTVYNGERPFPSFKINVLLVFKKEMNNEQANTIDGLFSSHSTNIEHKLYVTYWTAQIRVHERNKQSYKNYV